MYKLLALDIDDTLLNDEHEITNGTREALNEAMEAGVTVTLATGRMYSSAKKVANRLGLHVPLITYQGSLVKHPVTDEVLYERTVPLEATEFVFELCDRRGLHLQGYVDDELYVRENNDKTQYYSSLAKIPYIIASDFMALKRAKHSKLIIIDEPDVLDALAREIAPELSELVCIAKSKPNFLEIVHPEGTKGHALAHLAQHFGCTLAETIAVGDSFNDRDMIERAGLGVAMGNAVEPLKELADYVTFSNNEDGIKHVIDKFILGRE